MTYTEQDLVMPTLYLLSRARGEMLSLTALTASLAKLLRPAEGAFLATAEGGHGRPFDSLVSRTARLLVERQWAARGDSEGRTPLFSAEIESLRLTAEGRTYYQQHRASLQPLLEHTLTVRAFGVIPLLTLVERPLTILTGPSASGKSTLARLLALFKDYFWYLDLIRDPSRALAPFERLHLTGCFTPDTFLQYCSGRVCVTYQHGRFSLTITGCATPQEQEDFVYQQIYAAHLTAAASLEDSSRLFSCHYFAPIVQEACQESCVIGTLRSLIPLLASTGLAASALGAEEQRLASLFEESKRHYPYYAIPFLHTQYEAQRGEACLSVQRDLWVSATQAPASVLAVWPLLMPLDYALRADRYNHFVVEDPSLALSTVSATALFRRLLSLYGKAPALWLTLTTHSPALLGDLCVATLAHALGQLRRHSYDVQQILPAEYWLPAHTVAVYALAYSPEEYCHSLLDPASGLLPAAYLASLHGSSAADFSRLAQIYAAL